MKKHCHLCRVIMTILCAVLFLFSIGMDSAVFAEGHASDVVKTINVGFFELDGYHMVSSSGKRSGYGYDFLQEIGRYHNWQYNYVGYHDSWADMQQMLEDGTIDILTSAQKTPERETKFDFSDEAIGSSSALLTVKSGNTKYTAGEYAGYNGMVVGMLNHNSRNDSFQIFAQEHGFTYTSKYYDDTTVMEIALQNGNVDALLTSNLRVISNEWILDQFSPSNFYVMVKKGNTELLNEINNSIAQLDVNYPDWRSSLWSKYYLVDSGDTIPFTAEERAYIKALQSGNQKLTAIVEPDRAPYSYFENGTAKGIMPEIFNKIEDLTGISFDIIQADDRNDYFRRIQGEDHIDVRIDALNDFDAAEKSGYKLTDSYLSATLSKVTGKTASTTAVALTENGDPTQDRTDLKAGDQPLVYYPTVGECIDAVKNGNASETYVYTYCAQRYLLQDSTGGLTAVLLPQYEVQFSLGVARDDDPLLVTILDKAVNYVNGSISQQIILDQTKAVQHSLTFTDYVRSNPSLMTGISLIFALLVGLIGVLFYRQHALRLIEEKNTELNHAIEEANHANQAKTAFLSSMSHDMRTPLNGIIGFTDFATRAEDPQKKQEYLDKVKRSSTVLLSLINDTLNVSKIESGKASLAQEYVPAKDVFENLCIVIDSSAGQKGIQFYSHLEYPDKLEINIDQLKVQEIFMNLLSNAVKFTPEGGTIQFSVKEIGQHDNVRDYQFVVQDTGIGMSAEFMERMYEPFAQEHSSQDSTGSGTGLGLYITKRYIELMHGTIDVQSEREKGTTFTVLLSFESREGSQSAAADAIKSFDFTGKCFLLAEDNLFNSEIAETLLKEKGAEVITAKDGQAAYDIYQKMPENTFDAILMDVHMPVMGGYEATKKIRQSGKADAADVPIIAMTADAYEEDVQSCMKAGMNAHIAKPIDTAVMFSVIDHQLKAEKKSH